MSKTIATLEQLQSRRNEVKMEVKQYEDRFYDFYYKVTNPIKNIVGFFSLKKQQEIIEEETTTNPQEIIVTILNMISVAVKAYKLARKLMSQKQTNQKKDSHHTDEA